MNIPVKMYQGIPHSYLWIVPNGGHVPIYDSKLPFLATVDAFFSGGKKP